MYKDIKGPTTGTKWINDTNADNLNIQLTNDHMYKKFTHSVRTGSIFDTTRRICWVELLTFCHKPF